MVGWEAVFQVAVVGHAVVATPGEVVPYGCGPGTGNSRLVVSSQPMDWILLLTCIAVDLLIDIDENTRV